jgi:NADH dehydrogenase
MAYEKVVIIGGGFGGLNAAKALKSFKGEVYVIDQMNHHLFQPLLYQVATCALSPGNIAAPIRDILSNQKNAQVIMGEVDRIDSDANIVHLKDGAQFPFSYLIVAPGARHSYFGHPEWEKDAIGLKTLNDALTIRDRLLTTFEEAERMDSIQEAQNHLRFVVVGGGPTGVEMAGAIAELTHRTLFNNFRKIKPEKSQIFLIEGEKQILPSYPPDLAEKAKNALEKTGVKVLLNEKVEEINDNGVKTNKQFIETTNVIWAAGNQASPLLKSLNVPLDRQGRVIVNDDLSIPNHPNIFVIGDAAHFEFNGQVLPGIAPVAIQEAQYISKKILKKTTAPFKYFDKGNLATIGRGKAVGVFRNIKFSGFIAWWVWSVVHIFYLISFYNRVLVAVQWLTLYLTWKRPVRLITRPSSEDLR